MLSSAVEQINKLSEKIPEDNSFFDKEQVSIKNKAELEVRLQRVLDAIHSYH